MFAMFHGERVPSLPLTTYGKESKSLFYANGFDHVHLLWSLPNLFYVAAGGTVYVLVVDIFTVKWTEFVIVIHYGWGLTSKVPIFSASWLCFTNMTYMMKG